MKKMKELYDALDYPPIPPGPWRVGNYGCGCCSFLEGSNGEKILYAANGKFAIQPEIAEFLVYMRNNMPRLLESLKAQEVKDGNV